MAYDSTRKQVLLFGGLIGNTSVLRDDTWTWSGSWTRRNPTYSPPARWRPSLADDPARQAVVLFGGSNSGRNLGDTWTWDGSEWHVMVPSGHPTARSGAAMAYDAVRRVVVLFGGQGQGSELSDTWTWDGTNWTQMAPATSPSARKDARMAFDSARGLMVLFGGFAAEADTWTWDGRNWTEQHPLASPPGYSEATPNVRQMVYDTDRRRIMFILPAARDRPMDTWTWDGTIWKREQTAVAPPVAYGSGLAFHADLKVAVHFGGWGLNDVNLSDTWTWDGANWTKAA
jgi:hypothetical protein